ncbi:glucuronate isomerase [Propionibacterium acidifaciens F0233]|uniref:Uronate isomerase n=1 Tax=Propionibacterium acidifaciens F0233 TaxID=553198 RepID=U2RNF8_9ACTN|nr:glucuronate isomerase [Propionibacterium acidifaciens]AYW78591.1 glucuronate isomerase [Propionibacterium acidifaciens]ERK52257.1 glucuronate isomerase [Propionibacterium acidifaciens F0233]
MASPLTLNDDRLLPPDPGTRGIARRIYATTRELPIISPHGHVPPRWIALDEHFGNPARLLITPDHYINRVLHANGVELSELGVGRGEEMTEADNRRAFRLLCEHWTDLNGTAMRYWLTDQLVGIFGVRVRPAAETADAIYDTIAARLDEPGFRPRRLMDAFRIRFLATTDDPCDDLGMHAEIAADEEFSARHRVVPTFRPDRYLEPARPDWNELVDALGGAAGVDVGTLDGYTRAMAERRRYFKEHGAVSSDHSHADLGTLILPADEAARLYDRARRGLATADEALALRRHLFTDQARMACEDGLVMTVHPAVARNHDADALARYGADVGGDIPLALEATRALGPLLNAYGNHPGLHLVLFTLDEDVYSREFAPLAAWYRSVHLGVPWWFVDAPESIMRFKRGVTEMAGFSRISGMVDDTRAFCSIPARHDMSRRLDAAHLADLVATHRLDEDEAIEQAGALVVDNQVRIFKLDR